MAKPAGRYGSEQREEKPEYWNNMCIDVKKAHLGADCDREHTNVDLPEGDVKEGIARS